MLKANVPYATRILVRRPVSPGKFNGTVFVEVLNATAGWDGDPIWQSTHEYMIREGAAWVGVSTKPVTVDFLRESWGRPPYPARNTSRYADLSMPEFGQVWDMLSQTGALLKTPTSKDNPLSAFDVQRLIMVGYSQSVAYQVTYANSIHDRAQMSDGKPIYDGYYVAAGGGAKHITGRTDTTPESLPPGDARNLIRVGVPVIRFQNQNEVIGAYVVRQWEVDFPLVRFYEMAGGSHVDAHLNFVGGQALGRDLGLPPSFCPTPENPYNPIRIGYVQSALMEALDQWIASNTPPPASRFMQLGRENFRNIVLVQDADGNAVGGIRPPDIQVPLGTYEGRNSGPGFCGLYGGFKPFDDTKLKMLYKNHDAYVSRFTKAVADAMQEGFLLPEDAQTQRDSAAQSSIAKN